MVLTLMATDFITPDHLCCIAPSLSSGFFGVCCEDKKPLIKVCASYMAFGIICLNASLSSPIAGRQTTSDIFAL